MTKIFPGGNPNDGGSLGLVISLKTRSRLSHLIKRESLMFSLRQYCLDFPIFTMMDSKFYFSPTFSMLEAIASFQREGGGGDNDIPICTLCCYSYDNFFEAFITILVLFGFLKQSALMRISFWS